MRDALCFQDGAGHSPADTASAHALAQRVQQCTGLLRSQQAQILKMARLEQGLKGAGHLAE